MQCRVDCKAESTNMLQQNLVSESSIVRPSSSYHFRSKACSPQHARFSLQRAVTDGRQHAPWKAGLTQIAITGSTVLAPLILDVQDALAKEREFGIIEGRIASLYHPALMLFLFGSSVYAAWLGFQWRRLRLLPEQIKDLEAELPPKNEAGDRPHSPVEEQIADLKQARKELSKGNVRSIHANWGYLLLGVGTLTAVVGPVNTYLRVGKLFPGPHLYAGAGIVVLWAVAASMVPLMQKGNDTARLTHISCNVLNIALFAWQIPTGLEIVQKVFQFTQLP